MPSPTHGSGLADVAAAVAVEPRSVERSRPRSRGLMFRMVGNERVVVGCAVLLAAVFVDIFTSIPVFILLLTIVAIYGSNVPLLITFIGVSAFPGAARIVRAEVLSLMPREFITASRVIGSTPWRIMLRHILPNLLPIII